MLTVALLTQFYQGKSFVYMWSKIDAVFLKALNGEQLVDLKHKPLEDKEITKILGLQVLSLQER